MKHNLPDTDNEKELVDKGRLDQVSGGISEKTSNLLKKIFNPVGWLIHLSEKDFNKRQRPK